MGWNRKLIIPGFELQRDEEKGKRGKGKGSSSYIVFGFQFSVKSKDGFRHVPE